MTPAGRTLHIHLGHHKTGSSFLQACFAVSSKRLLDHGIDYPGAGKHQHAAEGGISSGNGGGLVNFSRDAKATTLPHVARAGSLFYSNESLMRSFVSHRALTRLADAATEAGFARVRLLLLVRDPVSHCSSMYQQLVKRGGATVSIDEFALRYVVPQQVENFIRLCAAEPRIDLTIRNYSVVRRDLRRVVTDWLGVPEDVLEAPAIGTVNRSLTLAELEMQAVLNAVLGRSGDLLSDPLCERLPEIRADDLRPGLDAQQRMWARLAPTIERINAGLDPSDRYRRDVDEQAPKAPGPLTLTPQQIRVGIQALGAEIARLRMELHGEIDLLDGILATEGNTGRTRRSVHAVAKAREKAGDRDGAVAVLQRLFAIEPDPRAISHALRRLGAPIPGEAGPVTAGAEKAAATGD